MGALAGGLARYRTTIIHCVNGPMKLKICTVVSLGDIHVNVAANLPPVAASLRSLFVPDGLHCVPDGMYLLVVSTQKASDTFPLLRSRCFYEEANP